MGSAAAQVGGALGIPIMVSALLATARPAFFEHLRKVTGLPEEEVQTGGRGDPSRSAGSQHRARV